MLCINTRLCGAGRACCASGAGRARRAGGAGGACRASGTGGARRTSRTGGARRAGHAQGASGAGGPIRPGNPLGSRGTGGTGWPPGACGAHHRTAGRRAAGLYGAAAGHGDVLPLPLLPGTLPVGSMISIHRKLLYDKDGVWLCHTPSYAAPPRDSTPGPGRAEGNGRYDKRFRRAAGRSASSCAASCCYSPCSK